MQTVTATAAKNKFGDVLHSVVYEKEPHLITRNGRNMAVVLDIKTFNTLVGGNGNHTELKMVTS